MSSAKSDTGIEGFTFVYRPQVRAGDIDSRNHVNNAVYSSYLEDTRNLWLEQFSTEDKPPAGGVDMILARVEIDFRSEITYGESVEVGVRVGKIGTRSFSLEYDMLANGRLAAQAVTVLVGFDYESRKSAPIPDRWLSCIEAAKGAQ